MNAEVRPMKTAAELKLNVNDPSSNVLAGARYLRLMLNRFERTDLALAAYNAGEDAVDQHGRSIPPFAETRAYIPAVLKLYRSFLGPLALAGYSTTLPPHT